MRKLAVVDQPIDTMSQDLAPPLIQSLCQSPRTSRDVAGHRATTCVLRMTYPAAIRSRCQASHDLNNWQLPDSQAM